MSLTKGRRFAHHFVSQFSYYKIYGGNCSLFLRLAFPRAAAGAARRSFPQGLGFVSARTFSTRRRTGLPSALTSPEEGEFCLPFGRYIHRCYACRVGCDNVLLAHLPGLCLVIVSGHSMINSIHTLTHTY